jgi:pimeloyl-ACP methyl ester carboxylesterase
MTSSDLFGSSVAFASKQIEVDGSSLNVFEFGTGTPVLLGHSYLWSAEMWRPQIEALSRRYRIIVPELWGHGRSGALPASTLSMRDLARQHLEMLDKLGIGQVALIGLSVGGMWGAELAIMAPERVSALVLMDTSLAAEPSPMRERYFGMFQAVEKQRGLPDAVRQAILPLFFAPDVARRRPDLLSLLDGALRAWPRDRLLDSIVPLGRIIFGRRDAMADLTQLHLPSLVITGAQDIPQPPERGRQMAERLGCRFIEVPEAGHIANLEAAEFVTAVLENFLAQPEAADV